MSVFFQEFRALYCAIKPLLVFLYIIIEHRKHPHFPTLKPDELVRIINRPVTVETAEISAVLFILRMLKPERKTVFPEFLLITRGYLFEIYIDHVKL